jgi:ubiquinone biosynthesis protein
MSLIKRSIGFTKTIKNVNRFTEILTVLGRNGLDEFIIKTNLHEKIPGFVIPKKRIEAILTSDDYPTDDFWQSIGFRLRKSFEELGPSFVKLGQLMASREDIFPPSLIRELKQLQNNAQPIEFAVAREVIEKNLKKPISEVFATIDEKPIGKASIGVAYRGKLKSGEEVVIKVRRPNIKRTIYGDFEIIKFITLQLEKLGPEVKILGLSRLIDDFFRSIILEMNFIIEASNADKLRKNLLKKDPDNILILPRVFKELSSEEILVLEFLDGTPFNKFTSMEALGLDMEPKLLKSVELFLDSMLSDGFFHADLHGGNFLKQSNGQIGIIDFGLMGTLSKKNRTNLIAILYALTTNNYENLVYEFLDVAEYEQAPDQEALVRDIQSALSPFVGLSVQDTDVNFLFRSIVGALSKHQLYLPREWFIIFRAIMVLDGVGKSLNLNLNVFDIISKILPKIITQVTSKEAMMEEVTWLGRDTLQSLRIIPRQLRWFFRELSKNNYTFDINLKGMSQDLKMLSRSINSVGFMLISCATLIVGTFFVEVKNIQHIADIPVMTWIFWSFSFYTFVRASLLTRN